MKPEHLKSNLLVLLITFSLISCRKNQDAPAGNLPAAVKSDWNEVAKSVAKDVSIKLNSIYFRKMLKHEVTMRFDGDANILLSSIIKRLPKYFEHEESMSAGSRSPGDSLLLSKYNWDIIRAASEDFTQMQLAVQTDAEAWDPRTYTPSVVYLTSDYDESESLNINGYDPMQNPISVSTETDPDVNYVVVSQNERTTMRDGQARLTVSNCLVDEMVYRSPYNPEADAALMMPIDCGGGGGGTGGGGGGSGHPQYVGTGHDGVLPTLIHRQAGTVVYEELPPRSTFNRLQPVGVFNNTTVYRKNYRHEKMRFIRCDNIGDIEGWPAGAPEIRMHVFEQNVLNPSENLQIFKEEFEPRKRKDIKGKWWDAGGVTMHLWEYVGSGTKASFGYYEYDPVLVPNETLEAIGQIVVDLLFISYIDSTTNPNLMTIYGNIRQSVATGIRSLRKKNRMSEYIGKDDYSIFNDEDQFNHSPGGTKFQTWPDL
jgi:hypothetical protein